MELVTVELKKYEYIKQGSYSFHEGIGLSANYVNFYGCSPRC